MPDPKFAEVQVGDEIPYYPLPQSPGIPWPSTAELQATTIRFM